jgi:hypothetical protein
MIGFHAVRGGLVIEVCRRKEISVVRDRYRRHSAARSFRS